MNLEELKNAVKLDHKIALYVPGTNGVSAEADNSEIVEAVAGLFSGIFGGASAHPVSGYWISDAGELVKENTVVIYSNCTAEQLQQNAGKVIKAAHEIKRDLHQEAVSVEIDSVLYLI